MKQILQNLKNGNTMLEEVPVPLVRTGHVLIKTHSSLISLGTEKMLVEFGRAGIISKARQQPEKVKQVLDKIKSDGLLPTIESVFNKLDEPLPLGYCNAGEVVAVGHGVSDFKVGNRVASNGPHAEYVVVPTNLCARIPDNVSYDEGTFAVIGSIGLQGIRLANPTFGETVVVVGLGLIGQITCQLLLANGCRVIGFDFDQKKVQLAINKGVEAFNASGSDVVKTVESLTNNVLADSVIITASTKSNDVISQAAQMSRKRGRIVLVGVIGLDINRADFYKKELSFQVSCSYGPGRYDDNYEINGIDYPLPYVRWTEQRNFEAILSAISAKRIDVTSLISERVSLHEYGKIYDNLGGGSIASILQYSTDHKEIDRKIKTSEQRLQPSKGVIGIIGAGNFTKMTMLPALKKSSAGFKYIASANGYSGTALCKKYGFEYSTTDYKQILNDQDVDLVLITTRHNQHAKMTIEALQNKKHVFVEKPLALNNDELDKIITAYVENAANGLTVTVGYNRRFAPLIEKTKKLLGNDSGPMNMIANMNAGHIPAEVWVHDMAVGGGRIVGEACHFIDLMIYLTGSKVVSVHMSALGKHPEENTDNAIITLKFENGSQGVINYFSNGHKSYSKERIEVYSQGRTLVLDNFRSLKGYGFKGFSSMSGKQDKGHKNQFQKLISTVKQGADPLIPFDELVNSTRAAIACIKSLKTNENVYLDA